MKATPDPQPAVPYPTASGYLRRRNHRRIFVSLVLLVLISIGGYLLWAYHGPMPPTEIYHGIVYSCQRMPEGPESSGLLHLVRADLNVPGVSIYVTPLDPQAVARGRQYRLKYVSTAVRENNLAAAVNGTLFDSDSTLIRLPGDWAKSGETVVANHVVSHIDPNTYLIWWDDNLIASHDLVKPPPPDSLARAKWGIGSQGGPLANYKVAGWAGRQPIRRTMIGFDSAKRLVWIAVFDSASEYVACETLARLGVPTAASVDGGSSSAMVLGTDAHGVRTGTVTGNWRPVAVQFGFRADPIR